MFDIFPYICLAHIVTKQKINSSFLMFFIQKHSYSGGGRRIPPIRCPLMGCPHMNVLRLDISRFGFCIGYFVTPVMLRILMILHCV